MAWTLPTLPVTLTTITTAWAQQTIVDNLHWLRAMTGGASPPGSGYSPESVGVAATTWTQKVNKNGDTMAYDLYVTRSAGGSPATGYLILGNNLAYYLGFDGAKHVLSTPRLDVFGDLYVSRQIAGFPSTGYIVLGSDPAHYVGFDGGNIVADGARVWTDVNTANVVTTAKILDGAVTPAKLAATVGTVPVGMVALWKIAAAPTGWVIDTDFIDRFPMGAGGGSAYSAALGATGGDAYHQHNIAHDHPSAATGQSTTPGGAVAGGGSSSADPQNHVHTVDLPPLGTTLVPFTDHRPFFRAVHYIRKT